MPSGAVVDFLAKLSGVKAQNGQWVAQCPAHDDRTASLSVAEGADGRVLVTCFAGCSTEAVASGVGVPLSGLFDAPLEASPRREVACYDYRDESGVLRYQVVRFEPKDFRQRRPDGSGGWVWNLQGVERVLYRLPELVGHPTVAVVEGEKDADRLWALGIPATTSVGGAGKWKDAYTGQLVEAGVTQVVIIPDNDEPGRQHAAQIAIAAQQAGLSARILTLPGVPVKGDVSDYLASHDADDLRQLLAPPVETVPWFDATAQLAARREEVVEAVEGRRIAVGLPAIDACIGGIRRGEVFGLMARPGTGKTLLLAHAAHELATTTDVGHVFFSLEMPASQIVGRIQQRVFGMSREQVERAVYDGRIDAEMYRETFKRFVVVDTGGLSIQQMATLIDRILDGPLKGVSLGAVTIDHLGLIGGDRKLTTYDRLSIQAREIKELAKRYACSVLLAVQPNRESGGDGSKELGLGSARDSGVVEEAMDYLVGMRRLDRSLTLSPSDRAKFRGVLFARVIKNRHGEPMTSEVAYHMVHGHTPREDPHMAADSEDIVMKIANAPRWNR